MKKFDIFISYRREDGSDKAIIIRECLKRDGYSVFHDVDSLTRGDFEKKIKDAIASCKDFILIVSKKALEVCPDEKNWVVEELACAIENKKNIIPVFLPGIDGFPSELPPRIKYVTNLNGIPLPYKNQFFEDFYRKLKDDYLTSKRTSHKIAIGSGVVFGFVLLLAVIVYKILPPNIETLSVSFQNENKDMIVRLERLPIQDELHFVKVDGGEYLMGIDRKDGERRLDESPMHRVRLDTFWIMDSEVTNGMWRLIMGDLGNYQEDSDFPKSGLDYKECQEFIKILNHQIKDSEILSLGLVFRLPTEAEWEYAAKGGMNQDNYRYSGNDTLAIVSSINRGKDLKLDRVKSRKPNSLGIYDMSGSLFEWCYDWYGQNYYRQCGDVVDNPAGPKTGETRIIRGGATNSDSSHCEVLNRSAREPSNFWDNSEYNNCGFRLVLGRPIIE